MGGSGFAFFYGNNAFRTYFFDGFGNQITDDAIVGRNGGDLRFFYFGFYRGKMMLATVEPDTNRRLTTAGKS